MVLLLMVQILNASHSLLDYLYLEHTCKVRCYNTSRTKKDFTCFFLAIFAFYQTYL